MAYKGAIKAGKQVVIELQLDHSASGEAYLWAAAGSSPGGGDSGREIVAPGGMGSIPIKPKIVGTLEIEADMTDDDDTGRLIVTVAGTVRHSEKITGDTRWAYAIT